MRRLLILSIAVVGVVVPPAGAVTSQSDDWPRLGASRLVTADGVFAAGEPVWLFVEKAGEHRHTVSHPLWATTTGKRGRFVLRAPYRGQIKHAAARNGGSANFELVAGNDIFWLWDFPARWTGSGWEIERGGLPGRIRPAS